MKSLFVGRLGSVIRVIQLIWKLKKHLFCAFESLGSWSFGSRVIVGLVQSLITWITTFPFGSCFEQFCSYFPKLIVNGIPAQRQFKWERSESYNYVIKRKSGSFNCSNQQLNGWISWIAKFICVGVDFSDHLYSRSVFSKQIVPNKWNVLSQSRALAFSKKCFICFNENSLEIIKSAFYFLLKALFARKIIKFYLHFLVM